MIHRESVSIFVDRDDHRKGDPRVILVYPEQRSKTPPCQMECPSSGRIREWIAVVAQRKNLGLTSDEAYSRAWKILTEFNPFPAVMGRVCPHPCEDGCNRADKDGAVSINSLERFLGDWALEKGLALTMGAVAVQPESIGVIGAGPSALSFAYQMTRRGYKVTVYEKHPEPGGMLRYGIPSYRLPKAILQAEIQRILDLGVHLKLNHAIDSPEALQELKDRHNVLYVGIGAQDGKQLGIPGEKGPNVWSGVEYLRLINEGHSIDLGEKVVVIGGGDSAVDAARTARRQGTETVLLYRRTRAEMPAVETEIADAEQEGVRIEYLRSPLKIERSNGTILSLLVQKMELGESDESGRKRPVPVPDSTYAIKTDSVICAVSQEPAWKGLESLKPSGGWMQVSGSGQVNQDIWAGGDVRGLGIASLAVGHGRLAAEAIHRELRGFAANTEPSEEEEHPFEVKIDLYPSRRRSECSRPPVEEWLKCPDSEISRGISETQFLGEVERCFSCGSCFGCERCWMYCNSSGYAREENSEPGSYFRLSLDQCEGCGKCVELCPCGFLNYRTP